MCMGNSSLTSLDCLLFPKDQYRTHSVFYLRFSFSLMPVVHCFPSAECQRFSSWYGSLVLASQCLICIFSRFAVSGLSINPSKSDAILFSTRQRLRIFPAVKLSRPSAVQTVFLSCSCHTHPRYVRRYC